MGNDWEVLKLTTAPSVWISSENAKSVADKGFHIIHAASNYFYLVRGVL